MSDYTTCPDGVPHECSPVVKFQAGWREWRAECDSCRWIGSYLPTKAQAEREAEGHECVLWRIFGEAPIDCS